MTNSSATDSLPPQHQLTTPRCTATTGAGLPCRFPPRRQTGLCINHDPAYRQAQVANRTTGAAHSTALRIARAHARRSPLGAIDPWALVDRASVQAMLDGVIRLELAGALPKERARNLLRALSLAARNFDTPPLARDSSRTARHNLGRYRAVRNALGPQLEAAVAAARPRQPGEAISNSSRQLTGGVS